MLDVKIEGDLEKQFLQFQQRVNNLHQDIAQELIVEMPKLMSEQANKVVSNEHDQFGYDYVSIASDNNKAEIEKSGANSTTIIAFNDHPQATYVEFGTGRVGEYQPHPEANSQGYQYYMDSQYKKPADAKSGGIDYWWHKKQRVVGLPSMPFIYKSLQEVQVRTTTYVSNAIRKALGVK